MERPTCKTCPYWNLLDPDTMDDANEAIRNLDLGDFEERFRFEPWGQCKRFPPPSELRMHPNLYGVDGEKIQGGRSPCTIEHCAPNTLPHDWCGEHPEFPKYIESTRSPADHSSG